MSTEELDESTSRLWEDVALRIRRISAAAMDELSIEIAARRYDELQILGGEFRQALVELVRAVPRAPKPLAALEICDTALEYARSLLAAAADRAALAAIDIEPDVADLVTLVARLRIAQRLQGARVRPTAQQAGVTPGYLSELRRVKKGLPSPDMAARLDQRIAAPTGEPTLREIVTSAKAERVALIEQRRHRRGGVTVAGGQIPADLRGQERLTAIADALRQNELLQHAVELLIGLPERDRRAITRLVEELARE